MFKEHREPQLKSNLPRVFKEHREPHLKSNLPRVFKEHREPHLKSNFRFSTCFEASSKFIFVFVLIFSKELFRSFACMVQSKRK